MGASVLVANLYFYDSQRTTIEKTYPENPRQEMIGEVPPNAINVPKPEPVKNDSLKAFRAEKFRRRTWVSRD
jgi:hypothetical protein